MLYWEVNLISGANVLLDRLQPCWQGAAVMLHLGMLCDGCVVAAYSKLTVLHCIRLPDLAR